MSAAQTRINRRGPTLRETALEDYPQIAALEARHGLSVKNYEEWTHLHLCNPLIIDLETACPIGWVIESEDKQIVGSVGNILLPYEFDGKRILAVTGRGLVSEKAYRSTSLLLLDQLLNQSGVELFLTNALTPASTAAFRTLGCERIPAGVWDRSAFWITQYPGFLESALRMRSMPMARPFSYPLAAAAFLRDAFRNTAMRDSDAEVQSYSSFDDRFDDFWEHLRETQSHRLLAVRSREMLEWHFQSALRHHRLWIAAVVDGCRMAAYAVFDRRDNANFGLKRARLVDFQSRDGTTSLLAPLLSWALRKCRSEGIHMLESVGAWLGKGELLDELAGHKRQLSTWTYVYLVNHVGLAARLRDARAWAPTLFDASASL